VNLADGKLWYPPIVRAMSRGDDKAIAKLLDEEWQSPTAEPSRPTVFHPVSAALRYKPGLAWELVKRGCDIPPLSTFVAHNLVEVGRLAEVLPDSKEYETVVRDCEAVLRAAIPLIRDLQTVVIQYLHVRVHEPLKSIG
jgi:hypothetical protein